MYRTYDEAQKEVDEHIAEYKRQAALSDYDWSVGQIDKVLGYYKNIYNLTDSEVKQYRDWILAQDDIENVELRIHFGNLEWRDWERHKKWHGTVRRGDAFMQGIFVEYGITEDDKVETSRNGGFGSTDKNKKE